MAIGYGEACPKPTRLDALERKETSRRKNEAKLRAWRKAVDARDAKNGFKCRWSGETLARTLELKPNRAERHHIEPRANRATRYDSRNGILVSLRTHERLTANELQIVGAKDVFFVDGKPYWNADHPLEIADTKTGESRWV